MARAPKVVSLLRGSIVTRYLILARISLCISLVTFLTWIHHDNMRGTGMAESA